MITPKSIFRCCKLTGESKTEAILTACLLLPPLHAATLSCLMRFLSEVAKASAFNKMDARSLAIVFTPSLFPVSESATNIKKVDSTNADLANKLDIVEVLIRNSDSVRTKINLKSYNRTSIIIYWENPNFYVNFACYWFCEF